MVAVSSIVSMSDCRDVHVSAQFVRLKTSSDPASLKVRVSYFIHNKAAFFVLIHRCKKKVATGVYQ